MVRALYIPALWKHTKIRPPGLTAPMKQKSLIFPAMQLQPKSNGPITWGDWGDAGHPEEDRNLQS